MQCNKPYCNAMQVFSIAAKKLRNATQRKCRNEITMSLLSSALIGEMELVSICWRMLAERCNGTCAALWYVISRLCTTMHCGMLRCVAVQYITLHYLLPEIGLYTEISKVMRSTTHRTVNSKQCICRMSTM